MNETTNAGAQAGPETFLDAAHRMGRRIAADARWEGDACTWVVITPDRSRPGSRKGIPATAGGMLYEGTSGIALFLAELAAVTGDEEVARAALGGIRYALNEGVGISDFSFGYHSGRVGIAYAAARVGELLGTPELYAQAEALLRPLAGNEGRDMGMDVIAGGGGGIPALLQLSKHVDAELALGIARRLGDNLIEKASRDADGWSWATMRSSSTRNLCGYAHGAAGIGHGLLELYAATGDGRYRYAAEQAFLYERRFYSEDAGNWPDLRNSELGEYQFEGRMDELRERLRAGDWPATPAVHYMTAWCHGAPGIGLSRLRAYQVLGDPVYLEEARNSFRSVERSISEEVGMNFSLCHGRGGNAETLLEGARILEEPELLEAAKAAALIGIQRYEDAGQPWSCGTMGGVQDPGLLLGEAGIGMFLLRLARPEVPSPLVITAPDESAAEGGRAGAEGYAAIQNRVVEEHFGRTLRTFRALGEDVDALIPSRPLGAAPTVTEVEAAHEALAARIAAEADGERRALLEDAFAVDRTRFELARSVEDYSREYLDALARLPQDELDWREGRVGLSSRARVVSTRYDWDGWLDLGDEASAPQEDDAYYLVQFAGGRANARRLSPFAALILQTVQEPATLDEVIAAVKDAVSSPQGAPDHDWLEDRVVEQLAQAYRAGFIGFARGLVGAGA